MRSTFHAFSLILVFLPYAPLLNDVLLRVQERATRWQYPNLLLTRVPIEQSNFVIPKLSTNPACTVNRRPRFWRCEKGIHHVTYIMGISLSVSSKRPYTEASNRPVKKPTLNAASDDRTIRVWRANGVASDTQNTGL